MRRWVLIAAVLGAGMVGAATLASGAVLVNQAANPSFEKPIGDMVGCGGVSAGNWTSVNAGGATQPVVVTSPVHRGRKAGQVRNDVEHGAADVANGFAQALPSFGASSQISLSSWVYPIAGIEEIELEGGTNWCIAENVALSFEVRPTETRIVALDGTATASAPPLAYGQWHHMVSTVNLVTGKAKLKVDGVLVATTNAGTPRSYGAPQNLFVGQGGFVGDGTNDFVFDQVALSSR